MREWKEGKEQGRGEEKGKNMSEREEWKEFVREEGMREYERAGGRKES